MTILAFLQNTWAKAPQDVQAAMRRAEAKGLRNELVKRLLFAGSRTGRRLQQHFGSELCGKITWEESSTVVTKYASTNPGAEWIHMKGQIVILQPEIIVCFGKVAEQGMHEVMLNMTITARVLHCVHPGHRGATVPNELQVCRERIQRAIDDLTLHTTFSV